MQTLQTLDKCLGTQLSKAEASVATCWSNGNPGTICMTSFPRCLTRADAVFGDAVVHRQQLEGAVATGEAQRRRITAKSWLLNESVSLQGNFLCWLL